MSLYAEYLKERTSDHIYECQDGFITWRYLSEIEVYIIDIYVRPEARMKNIGSDLVDLVIKEAKEKGCSIVLGTVVPGTAGADSSLRGLHHKGYELHSISQNMIVMKKDI